MSESIKIELPQLKTIDDQIAELQTKINALVSERHDVINTEAQKIATHKAGEEYEDRKGRRYRIDGVVGDYVDYAKMLDVEGASPMVFVRYYGVQLFKKGTTGHRESLYPPDKVNRQ